MSQFTQVKIDAPAGLNLTREPSQLPGTLWDEGENISFRYGISQKSPGYEQGFGQARCFPETIVPLRDDSQNYYWWAYAGKQKQEDGTFVDKIYKVTSSTIHEDVTPVGGVIINPNLPFKAEWTGDTLNAVPYLCKDIPYVFDGAQNFRQMHKFPDYLHFKTIRTYRNFMIGLNFSTEDFGGSEGFGSWEAGVHQNAMWWSHDIVGKDLDSDDPEAKSMWCDADPTRNSGWNFLGGTGGPIIDGKALRDAFIIYRERSLWQMTYTGGINVFAWKELFDDSGVLGLDCIVEIEGWHYVIGQSDIYRHNGVQKQSIADGIIRKEVFSTIDPDHIEKVFIAADYNNKEIMVCIPEAFTNRGGACNVAYVYNWEEKTWGRRDMPDVICSTYTVLSLPEGDLSWDAISRGGPVNAEGAGVPIVGGSWEEVSDKWLDSYFKYNPAEWGLALGSSLIDEGDEGADTAYSIYTYIKEPTLNGKNFEAVLEKKWITLNDYTARSWVSKIYPMVRKGKVDIYMCGTRTIDEGLSWKKIGTFDPLKDTKLSCRITGEFIHTKFVIPETSRAEIRGYTLEWSKIGNRA